jgi:hypothetical protein
MKFKGTVLIIDPCYVIKDEKNPYPYPSSNDPDFLMKLDTYNEWIEDHDDWNKCNYGSTMEVLGIKNYFVKSTLYGDGSGTVYKVDEDPFIVVDNVAVAMENEEDLIITYTELGNYGIDSGLIGIFDLDEVRKYNPNIDEWIASHQWCATIIPEFDGEIEYYIDDNINPHVVGKGNINFFTL